MVLVLLYLHTGPIITITAFITKELNKIIVVGKTNSGDK